MVEGSKPDRALEVSYLIGTFMSEHLVRLYRLFDGDLLAAIVLATVAHHSVQRFYEEVARESEDGLDALVAAEQHVGRLRHTNSNSVSEATGIPRETVRRKVKALAAKGLLSVGERGQLTVPAGIAKRFVNFDVETARRFETCARRVLPLLEKSAVSAAAEPSG